MSSPLGRAPTRSNWQAHAHLTTRSNMNCGSYDVSLLNSLRLGPTTIEAVQCSAVQCSVAARVVFQNLVCKRLLFTSGRLLQLHRHHVVIVVCVASGSES